MLKKNILFRIYRSDSLEIPQYKIFSILDLIIRETFQNKKLYGTINALARAH